MGRRSAAAAVLVAFISSPQAQAQPWTGDIVQGRYHISFMTGIATASHFWGVGEIGWELAARGQLFSWTGFTESHAWARHTADFPFVPMGNDVMARALGLMKVPLSESGAGIFSMAKRLAEVMPLAYKEQYEGTKALFEGRATARHFNGTEVPLPKPDLVICDVFAFPCVDLAFHLKVPYMVTISGFLFGVGSSSYLMDGVEGDPEVTNTLHRRLWHMVLPLLRPFAFRPLNKALKDVRAEVGAPAFSGYAFARWKGRSILNTGSFFGWDEPRKLSPWVHLVGPIITDRVRSPSPLEEPLKSWMDAAMPTNDTSGRQGGIVLVALGSLNRLTPQRARVIVDALKRLVVDEKIITGAIIANRAQRPPGITDSELETANIRWESWVPQPSILAHPATTAFVSHGGQESVYESIWHGVPLLVLPSHGDQFINGRKAEAAGVGMTLAKESTTSANIADRLRRIIRDESGSVKRSSERMRVLIDYASRGKASKGADVVETELRVGNDHLRTLPERAGVFRAYNLDIYTGLIVACLLLLWVVKSVVGGRRRAKEHDKQS